MSVVGGENAMDTLNGWFKELYADQEVRLVPDAAWVTKNIKFNKSEAGLGNLYHQPVVLTQEQGFTYAGPSAGAFALNAPIAAVLKDAQVQGAQILLRSQIDYESLARAQNTKGSFGEASRLLVENMLDAISKRLELMFIYGRSPGGIGILASGTTGPTNGFTLTAATWSAGLWAGMEGATLHLVTAPSGTYPVLTTAATPKRTPNGGTKVVSVNFATLTVTVTASTLTAPVATDIVILYGTWFAGAAGVDLTASTLITFIEAIGLDGIIRSSGSTLFNIDQTVYGLFTGNNPSAFAALTVTNVLANLLPAIGKGLMEDVVLLCSNTAFQSLVNPTVDPVAQASNTNVKVGPMITQAKSDQLQFGASGVTIVGAQGKITIQPHLFVKDKDMFCFSPKNIMRVGATDVTFNTPGSKGGEFFLHMPSNAGYELRCYANQGLFSPKVGQLTKMLLS